MHSVWMGEFFGTTILIVLGEGVNAGVTLKKSKVVNGGWLVVTTGWGLAVLCGVLVAQAFGSAGAHLNPAVSMGAAVLSGDYSQLPVYWSAQLLGAMAGATLVVLHYGPHWKWTEEPEAKLGIFCTSPAIRSTGWNLLSETLGTAVLVLVAAAIFSRGVAAAGFVTGPSMGVGAGLGPALVGCLVWGIGLSLGGTTGYAINPARDLGPRLVHALLPIPGKGGSDWGYAWIPVVGPLLGGALVGVLLKFAHL